MNEPDKEQGTESLDAALAAEVEAEDAERKNKLIVFVALFVGVVGVLLGAYGVLQASGAKGEIAAVEERMLARPDRSEEFTKAVADVEERLVRLGGELVRLQRADQELQRSVQTATSGLQREIGENRRALGQLAETVTELTEQVANLRTAPRAASAPAAAAAGPAAAGGTAEAAPEGGIHVVQSGDTLSRIASQYGVSLTDLQRANPAVNPRALQIGQRIVIPQR